LKATAFSLRKTQCLLGIDSQVEIVRPFLMQERLQAPAGSHFTIDISRLQEQYIRFVSCFKFYKKAVEAYAARRWDYYLTLHRVIRSSRPIFFGGLINPSHDLNLRKINDTGQAIIIGCSAYTAKDGTHLLLSCPDGLSRDLYGELLYQLRMIDDGAFATAVNNLLTTSVETLLMPETFALNEIEMEKIDAANRLAGAA